METVVAELLMRRKIFSISVIFISQFHFKVLETITREALFYCKNTSKRELQQITSNYSSDIEFKRFYEALKRTIFIFSGRYNFTIGKSIKI